MEVEAETRSDDPNAKYAGTTFFSSVKEAFQAWKTDPSIWKISWAYLGDPCLPFYRFHMKTKRDQWESSSEEKLCSLSPEYKAAGRDDLRVFFVNQLTMPPNGTELCKKKLFGEITEEEKEREWNLGCLKEILTEEQFAAKYCQ